MWERLREIEGIKICAQRWRNLEASSIKKGNYPLKFIKSNKFSICTKKSFEVISPNCCCNLVLSAIWFLKLTLQCWTKVCCLPSNICANYCKALLDSCMQREANEPSYHTLSLSKLIIVDIILTPLCNGLIQGHEIHGIFKHCHSHAVVSLHHAFFIFLCKKETLTRIFWQYKGNNLSSLSMKNGCFIDQLNLMMCDLLIYSHWLILPWIFMVSMRTD